tara:strand:- start:127 stop:1098 length:972 start_codon:yes stop_codon:yes gene_type:complete
MLNTNIGDNKMSNLLLENFINEINAKREDAINKVFSDRMISIEKQINEIPKKVELYNERCSFRDGFEKSVAKPNGFITQDLEYKSSWSSFVSLCDSFDFSKILFSVKNLSEKDYRPRKYNTYQYELRDMEVIKKEIMKLSKHEINSVFDMYLSRVCDTVTKIDYCSEITNCEIKSFEQKGYPVSELAISTANNTNCTIRTSVKWNFSKYGLMFGQYPTTIHNIKREGLDKTGSIHQVASDNFNHVWTSFKAIEKNTKTNRAIARLEEELAGVQRLDPNDRFYNAKYEAKRVKRLNERIAKEKAKLIDVKAFRDVGQSLIKAVA